MRYILVGTEGEATEPASIEGVLAPLRQQSPRGYANLEVVPLPVGGHHGHGDRLITEFERRVTEYISNPDNCVEPTDDIVKYLEVDYDKMEEHDVAEDDFRKKVIAVGAIPIITKPKSEYFVARLFYDEAEVLEKLDRGEDPTSIINRGVKAYNDTCEYDFQRLPLYSKKQHRADSWFGMLFDRNPDFLRRAIGMNVDISQKYYTEIPELIRVIARYFK